MTTSLSAINPLAARRLLRFELRLLCEAADVRQGDIGHRLGMSRASFAQILTGKHLLSLTALEVMLHHFGVPQRLPRMAELLTIARSRRSQWAIKQRGVLGRVVRDGELGIGLVGSARTIRAFDTTVIALPLRTLAYSQELFAAFNPTDSDPDDSEESEDQPCPIVELAEGATLHWVVEECALRRPLGGENVMSEQYLHLLDASRHPNITIQVIPQALGAHPGLTGPFLVFRSDDWTVAYQETTQSAHYHAERATVRDFEGIFDDISLAALNPDQSRNLITRLVDDCRVPPKDDMDTEGLDHWSHVRVD